ncbi:MAG: hypothetical protein F9K35_21100 [Burkholderiaceae bacterium]|nr:MAG: hypothetical protein F9K35_21100 [Burkholderiaceae bacterium]
MTATSPVCPVLLPALQTSYTALLALLCQIGAAVDQTAWAVVLQTCLGRRSLAGVARQACPLSATRLRTRVGRLLAAHATDAWEVLFNHALRALWQPRLRGQRVVLVGDETHLPFWGQKRGALVGELRGGAPKNGASRFFTYVTLCALWRGQRILLAVARWRADETLADVLTRLGQPLLAGDMTISAWVWDRGGATVAMLRWFEGQGQPFVVAAPRRGPKAGVAARLTALEALWGGQRRQPPAVAQSYTLHPEKGSGQTPITVMLVVGWERVKKGRSERRQRSLRRSRTREGQIWRAVAWFTDGHDWRGRGGAVQAFYRRRQSIESSYRMSHATRGRTSSRDARYRFVLFAVSQLLQAVWVWLARQARAASQKPLLMVDLVEDWVWSGRDWLREGATRSGPLPGSASRAVASGGEV